MGGSAAAAAGGTAGVQFSINRFLSGIILHHPPLDDLIASGLGDEIILRRRPEGVLGGESSDEAAGGGGAGEDDVDDEGVEVALPPEVEVLEGGGAVAEGEIEPLVALSAGGRGGGGGGRGGGAEGIGSGGGVVARGFEGGAGLEDDVEGFGEEFSDYLLDDRRLGEGARWGR